MIKTKKRFEIALLNTTKKQAPLIAYYKAQEKFHAIDGSRPIEAIADHLTRIVDQL
jgi:adenylate kinase